MSAPTYEFVEGATSDLAFVARGRTPDDVFAAAAEALLAATVEDPDAVAEVERVSLELEEPDLELLLLRFLNELVYLRDARGLLLHPGPVSVKPGAPARLVAELRGERLRSDHRLGAEVKAATAHGLRVAPGRGGWVASVTLDV